MPFVSTFYKPVPSTVCVFYMEHSTKGETENMTKFPGSSLQLTSRHVATTDKLVLSAGQKYRFKQINQSHMLFNPIKRIYFQTFKTLKTLLQWRQSLQDQFSHKHPVDSASWLSITAWDGLVLWGEWSTHNVLRKYWFYDVLWPHDISWPSSLLKVSL